MSKKIQSVVASLLVAGVLSACGGGDDPPPVTTAEGAYSGAVTNSPAMSVFSAVVLEDGQVWTLYGNNIGATFVVDGLVQGQGTSTNGSFTSSTVKDFGYDPAVAGTLNATYVAGTSLTGTVSSVNGTVGFNGTAIPAATYNYNTPALLSNVVGSWSMASTSGDTIALAISANGTFTGTAAGVCALSGTLAPRPSGKNIFDVQMTFGPAPCILAGWRGAGIGIYTTLANGTHEFIVAVVDVSRTYGTAAFGTR